MRALMAYRHLLLLHPDAMDGWAGYAALLLAMNQSEDARKACNKCLDVNANHMSALVTLGKLSLREGQLQEAEALFNRALSLDSRRIDSRLDLARSQSKQGRLEEAMANLALAAELDPANTVITNLLIDVLIRLRKWSELHVEMLRRVNADFAGPFGMWERSCVNLLFGDMAVGWEEHESRWDHPNVTTLRRKFRQPLWNGEALEEQTILLHWEQGIGDTLMFVRYARMVKRLGGRVILLVQPELADLMATCPGLDEIVVEGDTLPRFDFHLPLLSLPRVFHTNLDSIPAEIPYLSVPGSATNREGLAALLARAKGRIRIGISWAGSPTYARDTQRSIPPEAFLPLGALPDVAWYSFQFKAEASPQLPGLVTMDSMLKGFANTASALAEMDLVITVDTALAHLAGAMGIPTLLLVSYLPDWRWLMGRDDSPWYPTLRIYRQSEAGEWDPVIRHILTDLSGVTLDPQPEQHA
jgi:tetratricopeptide (TPR) repeat protein